MNRDIAETRARIAGIAIAANERRANPKFWLCLAALIALFAVTVALAVTA